MPDAEVDWGAPRSGHTKENRSPALSGSSLKSTEPATQAKEGPLGDATNQEDVLTGVLDSFQGVPQLSLLGADRVLLGEPASGKTNQSKASQSRSKQPRRFGVRGTSAAGGAGESSRTGAANVKAAVKKAADDAAKYIAAQKEAARERVQIAISAASKFKLVPEKPQPEQVAAPQRVKQTTESAEETLNDATITEVPYVPSRRQLASVYVESELDWTKWDDLTSHLKAELAEQRQRMLRVMEQRIEQDKQTIVSSQWQKLRDAEAVSGQFTAAMIEGDTRDD